MQLVKSKLWYYSTGCVDAQLKMVIHEDVRYSIWDFGGYYYVGAKKLSINEKRF